MSNAHQLQQIGATVRQGINDKKPFGQICDSLDAEFNGTFYWLQSGEEIVIYRENDGSRGNDEVWRGKAHP